MSFAERIDWDAYQRGLNARGIAPSEATLARIRKLTEDNLGTNDGTTLLNENFFTQLVTRLVTFLQSAFGFGSDTSGKSPFEQSDSTTEYAMLNRGMMNLYLAMRREGGEIAQLAELTTNHTIAGSGRLKDNMYESPFNQVKRGIEGLTTEQVEKGTSLNFADQGQRYPVIPVSEPASPSTPRTTTPQLTSPALQG